MAPFFHEAVDADAVVSGYAYANPADQTVGTNAALTTNSDPLIADTSPAGLWGYSYPALAAVEAGVDTPNGEGTNDAEPEIVGRGEKPVPQDTCAFVGENRELTIIPVDNNGNQINAGPDSLQYVAENLEGTDVQVTAVAPQDPITGQIAIPTMAAGVNLAVGDYRWSVRSSVSGVVVAYGEHTTEAMATVGDQASGLDGYTTICVNDSGTLLEGVVVVILQGETVLQSGVTDSEGVSRFNLHPGAYVVRLIQPDGKTTEHSHNVK